MGGVNVHIDETPKAWKRKITQEEYEIAVGLRCADCLKLILKECKCRKK